MDQLEALRQKLIAATDRMAEFEAELLNVHVEFPLFQRLALPLVVGHTKIPGIKIHDTRMMRLMEEDRTPRPAKIERAYHQADTAVQRLIDSLAA